MHANKLYVFTARFNPLRWRQPDKNYELWVEHMLDSGVNLIVGEVQYGEREHNCQTSLNAPCSNQQNARHIKHIPFRAFTPAWTKENILTQCIARTPEADNICWSDADVFFEKPGWAAETVHALQLYHWIQPWHQAIDRGPNQEILNDGRIFRSFCYQYEQGAPLVPDQHGWKTYGHPYPHPGYCHATHRRVLEYTGGLFELGGMGAADHAMCLALVGKAQNAAPRNCNGRYMEHLLRWQRRVQHAVHGRIGYANNVINHRFHGKKKNRQYLDRWQMFLRHGFDPDEDLKRNTYGILEWAGNKPELEREWTLYLRSRSEDDNCSE